MGLKGITLKGKGKGRHCDTHRFTLAIAYHDILALYLSESHSLSTWVTTYSNMAFFISQMGIWRRLISADSSMAGPEQSAWILDLVLLLGFGSGRVVSFLEVSYGRVMFSQGG
jgi:hypothetical protein